MSNFKFACPPPCLLGFFLSGFLPQSQRHADSLATVNFPVRVNVSVNCFFRLCLSAPLVDWRFFFVQCQQSPPPYNPQRVNGIDNGWMNETFNSRIVSNLKSSHLFLFSFMTKWYTTIGRTFLDALVFVFLIACIVHVSCSVKTPPETSTGWWKTALFF